MQQFNNTTVNISFLNRSQLHLPNYFKFHNILFPLINAFSAL